MKSVSIIAIAVFALVALCSSAPVADQQAVEDQARLDIYNDFLANLFSGLVSTTMGSVSNFLNQMISENVLGMGKRDVEVDLVARVNPLTFLYENVLQQLFSGLVSNTFSTINSTLNNLIETNPLGLGKRDVEVDLVARVNPLTFLYENVLQQLFSGLVSNTFSTINSTLNNLIVTNPLGLGKRAAGVNVFQFLYDNVVADLFGGLVSNTANYLQGALNGLINKPLASIGKRSVNIQEAQAIIAQVIPALVSTFKKFAQQALASLSNPQQLAELVKENIAFIKATVANLAQQLSHLIPSAIATEVSDVLALLQSSLIYWTSGLGSSLGPVIGPFRP